MKETVAATPSRREFVAALAVISAASAGPALAQDVKLPDAKSYDEALNVVIRYRFGMHLDEAQLRRVHASVIRGKATADVMKRIELSNSEDPITAFRADLP